MLLATDRGWLPIPSPPKSQSRSSYTVKTFSVWLVVSVNTVVTTWWKGAEGTSLLFPLLRIFPFWPVGGDPGKQLGNHTQMLFFLVRGIRELVFGILLSWSAW